MNREERGEVVHALVHVAVELCIATEVFADAGELLRCFLQETIGDDILDVGRGNFHLLEAVLDAAQAVGDVRKAATVKDGLLHAGHETETQILADLAHFTQEAEVENERLVPAAAEIVEQLVHDQEQPLIGEFLVELGHHRLQGRLVLADFVGGWELVVDAPRGEGFLQVPRDDFPQGHLGGADFEANDFELAGDGGGFGADFGVGEKGLKLGVFRDGRDDGHEVRFAGAVVADDEQPAVVLGRGILQLRNHDVAKTVGHRIRDDVGGDVFPGLGALAALPQFDDRLDGLELDQFAVFHVVR